MAFLISMASGIPVMFWDSTVARCESPAPALLHTAWLSTVSREIRPLSKVPPKPSRILTDYAMVVRSRSLYPCWITWLLGTSPPHPPGQGTPPLPGCWIPLGCWESSSLVCLVSGTLVIKGQWLRSDGIPDTGWCILWQHKWLQNSRSMYRPELPQLWFFHFKMPFLLYHLYKSSVLFLHLASFLINSFINSGFILLFLPFCVRTSGVSWNYHNV